MKNILFINGCIRMEKSNTLRLAKSFLSEFSKERTQEVDLNALKLVPLDRESLEKRDKEISNQNFDNPDFELAKQFKEADMIVLAAPFWEGTFPAMVHTYLEHICITGLTFTLTADGYKGLCRAKEAVFFTTRGGIYEYGPAKSDEHAIGVLKTIFKMLGIEKLTTIAAEGLDIKDFDCDGAMKTATKKALCLGQKLQKELYYE